MDIDATSNTISTELRPTLPGSAYLDPASFAAERERVLGVRTKDGTLGGHYDVCRHRGSRLALEGAPDAALAAVPSGGSAGRSSVRTTRGRTRSPASFASLRS